MIKKLEAWQKRKLFVSLAAVVVIGVAFLVFTCSALIGDKTSEDQYWHDALTPTQSATDKLADLSNTATKVTAGTYVENMKSLSLKDSSFALTFQVWFRWEGDEALDMAHNFHIYKGNITKSEVLEEVHENGVHYQLLRCDATVSKNYWTIRFPLESHQLRFYIEPSYTATRVIFEADKEHSSVNRSLGVTGYDLVRSDVGTFAQEYDSNHGNPKYDGTSVTSELVTAMEVNRNGWGLYIKCFVALLGTITWSMITLFLSTYHHVDPLSMIPAALFGTVTNVMVGANLLPDALQMGLLEFVNIWGILSILAVALAIININRIRSKYQDKEFSSLYGRAMFYTLLVLIVAGHILLPVSAMLVA